MIRGRSMGSVLNPCTISEHCPAQVIQQFRTDPNSATDPRRREATAQPPVAAREVSRRYGGRRRAPRSAQREEGSRRAVEAVPGRAARRRSRASEADVLAVGGGIEPPTFRLTAGRCTNSTTPQRLESMTERGFWVTWTIGQFSDFDEDVVAFDFDGEGLGVGGPGGFLVDLSGADVEMGGVQGTGQQVRVARFAAEDAFVEGCAGVRADVVHRVDLPVHLRQHDRAAVVLTG